MGHSSKTLRIGVIAEEVNDVDVLYEYTGKIIKQNQFSMPKFVGHGCGALRRKCQAWAQNLVTKGCTHIVVLHDLDRNDEKVLRGELDSSVKEFKEISIVLIPIEELEAWLLADPEAIQKVFNMQKTPNISQHPERIKSPKEYLATLVAKGSKSIYINTMHNRKLAAAQKLTSLKKCPSFSSYPTFLKKAVG